MMYGWSQFGEYGFSHWVIFALTIAVILYPIGRVLGRLGFSPFWCVIALVPFFNLVALWILAFSDWPAVGRKT